MNKKELGEELVGILMSVLEKRKGFDYWFHNIDAEIQDEILDELAEEVCEFLKYEDHFDEDM